MSALFLTADDLKHLTGRLRPSAQIRWLRERGWPHDVNALGRPVVATAEVERRLTGLAQPRSPEPNWSAIRK